MQPRFRRLRVIALVSVLCIAGVIGSLAIPVPVWRTGDQGLVPLRYTSTLTGASSRIWIDTDAACGHGARTDPDDCLAISLLARAPWLEIVGVSTVFGNSGGAVVDATVSALRDVLWLDTGRSMPVWSGAAAPGNVQPARPAQEALIAALEAGPLTIVALGPLTNIAFVIRRRPDLVARIATLVVVMGRRPGHIFHPAEGVRAGSFLGHGPVFRDFNFTLDVNATRIILGSKVDLTLVPYDAARGIEITPADVSALAASSRAGQWLAPRLEGWLTYWREQIGREGFYPFDLVAAATVVDPRTMRCAEVRMWIGEDDRVMLPGLRPTALLVADANEGAADHLGDRRGRYCAAPQPSLKQQLLTRLLSPHAQTPPG